MAALDRLIAERDKLMDYLVVAERERHEAEDELYQCEAEVARLKDALTPFVRSDLRSVLGSRPDLVSVLVTPAEYARARSVLGEGQ